MSKEDELKKIIVDITTDHDTDTLEEVMDVYVAKFQAVINSEINQTLDRLKDQAMSYRTHDMKPPFPSAVPIEAIEKERR